MTAIAIDDETDCAGSNKSLSAKSSISWFESMFYQCLWRITYLQKNKTDVLFLDIKIPDISGLEVSKSFTKPANDYFTTAYTRTRCWRIWIRCNRLFVKAILDAKIYKSMYKSLWIAFA